MQPQAFFPRGWDFRPLPKFPKLEAPRAISQGGGAARNSPSWGRGAEIARERRVASTCRLHSAHSRVTLAPQHPGIAQPKRAMSNKSEFPQDFQKWHYS